MPPAGRERRSLIADSAIRIIARDGVRALTHRAVDHEAQIPQGSTSYHAKTRVALLELIVDELSARSAADAEALSNALPPGGGARTVGLDELTALLAGLIDTLTARRDEMTARYALLLELDDAPRLRAALTTESRVHEVSRQVTTAALEDAGIAASAERVAELIALTDSLVFHRIALAPAIDVRPIIAAYLRGIAATCG